MAAWRWVDRKEEARQNHQNPEARSALRVFTRPNYESDSVSIYRGRNQFGNRGAVW